MSRFCKHDNLKETGKFDDLNVYLECVKCGETVAEDRSDWECGRYYWDNDCDTDEDGF